MVLTVRPSGPLAAEQAEVLAEGGRLLGFLAAGREHRLGFGSA